jgi:hypothetical protein
MTDVSEQMYPIICTYCANCTAEKKCLADVPWYCVSIYCKYFAETSLNAEKIKSVEKRKRQPSMKRLMKKVLVETF